MAIQAIMTTSIGIRTIMLTDTDTDTDTNKAMDTDKGRMGAAWALVLS